MAIEIDESRRARLVAGLQAFFLEQFDENLSHFRAEQLFDFLSDALGPLVYNQAAVQNTRKFMQQRLDDLDGELHEPENSEGCRPGMQ